MIKLERLSPVHEFHRVADYQVVNTNILITKNNRTHWDVWIGIGGKLYTIFTGAPSLAHACEIAQAFIEKALIKNMGSST